MLTSFFFNDTATTEIYTLSLHDALPISRAQTHVGTRDDTVGRPRIDQLLGQPMRYQDPTGLCQQRCLQHRLLDRKSTRLNSSHANISYAVFCLKKKNVRYIIELQLNDIV